MASILKVDTLQKPDGSTPTAADLGIDVAGSVVQVYHHPWSGEEIVSTYNVWMDMNNSVINFTPKYSNSKLLIVTTPAINRNTDNGGAGGCSFRITVDGVVYGVAGDYHEIYAGMNSSTVDIYHRPTKTTTYNVTSTSPVTIKMQLAQYGSAGFSKVNQASKWESTITVYEIAQ